MRTPKLLDRRWLNAWLRPMRNTDATRPPGIHWACAMERLWDRVSHPAGGSDGSWLHRDQRRSGGGIPRWHVVAYRGGTRSGSVPADCGDPSADTPAAKGTHHPHTAMATQRAECLASGTTSTAAVATDHPLRFTVALAWCVRSTRQPCTLGRPLQLESA